MKKAILFTLFSLYAIFIYAQNERWDDQFPPANAPNGDVLDMAKIGNDIYVGGSFTTTGGITVNNIAKWDGTSWSALGSGTDGTVYAMAKWNNKLYIGGSFTTVNGVAASNIAVWDGVSWSALGAGVDNIVFDIVTEGDFKVYAGGSFLNAGSAPANRIALWDGTNWSALGSGINGTVNALEVWDTLIIAGGMFSNAGGNSASNLAYWDGTNWNELGGGTNGNVYAVYAKTDSIMVGGNFSLVNTSFSANNFAVWNGTNWSTLGSGTNDVVYDFVEGQSDLYMTGGFSTVNGISANNIALWNGASWSNLGDGLQDDGFALLELNRDIYVGGWFTHAGLKPSENFARWGSLIEITDQPNNFQGCNGDSLLLSVAGTSSSNISYQWQLNGTDIIGATNDTLIINPLTTNEEGSYTCVLTNNFGNIVTDTAVIDMIISPTVSMTSVDTTICENENITLLVNETGESVQLQWYMNSSQITGANTTSFNIIGADMIDAGDYFCTALNVCGSDTSDTISLTINALPVVSFTGLDTIYCNTDLNDTLYGVPSGGTFSGNGMTGNIFNPLSLLGNHTITYAYTDGNGCTNSHLEVIEVVLGPTLTISGLESGYCYNETPDTLTGLPSGGTFSGNGMIDSIFNPALSVPGNFIISYSMIDTSGCILMANENVIVYAPVNAVFTGLNTSYCPGNATDTFSVTPSGGIISGAVTDTIFNPDLVGAGLHEIYYTFTDSNSCTSTDTFTVNVANNLVVDLGNDTSICAGEMIYAGNGYEGYLWSTGDTTTSISVTQTGNYEITVTDNFGCQGSDQIVVSILTTPYIDLGPDLSITTDQTTILGAGGNYSSYLWNTGATTNYIVIDGSALGAGQYEYWVIAGASSGCNASDTVIVNIGFGIFVENNIHESIRIYPNPAKDKLIIEIPDIYGEKTIKLVNIEGQVIYEKVIHHSKNIFDTSSIPPGIYTLSISTVNETYSKKLVIF